MPEGTSLKVVEPPPGPPVMSPIVAEVYGPDEAGRIAVAKKVRQQFANTADIVAIDDSVEDSAPKRLLKVDQSKAAQLGVAWGSAQGLPQEPQVAGLCRSASQPSAATPLQSAKCGAQLTL